MQDEIMGNVLENLEMQIGVLLDRFSELEGCVHRFITYPPRLTETMCGVFQKFFESHGSGSNVNHHLRCSTRRLERCGISTTLPQLKVIVTFCVLDLLTCCDLLEARLGRHFLHAASTNRDQHVSAQVGLIFTL